MEVKIRTGDLFLGNRWTIDAIISHAVDQDARWSDVGIFDVDIFDVDDNSESSLRGVVPVPYVFLLYDGITQKVPLDILLRDQTLQGAAHRQLIHRDRNIYIQTIKSAIKSNSNIAKEDISILIQEYKGNIPDRTGYSSAEAVGKILSAVKIIPYKYGTLISSFQEGGTVDDIYGEEIPLVPRRTRSEFNSEDISVDKAKIEIDDIMRNYVRAVPLMTIQNSAASSQKAPRKSSHLTTDTVSDEQLQNPSQSSYLHQAQQKKFTNNNAAVDSSVAMQQRLKKLEIDRAAYNAAKPLPN